MTEDGQVFKGDTRNRETECQRHWAVSWRGATIHVCAATPGKAKTVALHGVSDLGVRYIDLRARQLKTGLDDGRPIHNPNPKKPAIPP